MRLWNGRVSAAALLSQVVPSVELCRPAPRCCGGTHSSCEHPVSPDSTAPQAAVRLCPATPPRGSSRQECPLFTWGTAKGMVKLLDGVRAFITPQVRQRSSRVPPWAGVTCAAEPRQHHVIPSPAPNTPACCSPSGSVLASLK